MNKKQQAELMATHRALIQIRLLAAAMMRSNVADEQVERIYAIADAFHEVPDAIARGTDLDPSLFVRCAADADIVVPPDYPA
ncbi:hypothetical protein WJ05_00485 [Burkholderia vietnamiensis]|uniref:hypothetical protein n=1 Tax=Burkholderia vietnamiensis TaxID=60552 RepID=UPI000770C473|nr:hypothetical protein [Burkholderia vietnamiensis]KVF11924.1 hypothetical protein WJ05_00485 [Burkholderia vietnamiensis]